MTTDITVVTLANAGRLDHVVRQAQALPPGTRHIVIALGDEDQLRRSLPTSLVYPVEEFSLAEARNVGGDLAARTDPTGNAVIIFLDADCLPGAGLHRPLPSGTSGPSGGGRRRPGDLPAHR
ncbi:hypothetical protein QP028_11510 [Corynebacterium suedekumii]|nr:hypothetical protein QP028_11510 [Corynebacterium suedekumii]